ncbi:TAXI family TRAP transporter solute-binding subunit [Pusillimonas sp. ANT_WB101]|uniref:TAXI family TRAP transporter solute-binding subunit n=1 Tax=Pusillimonas sp. ANT_WB101 TaxID=2597356 RepID=UPI0011EDB51C|nr:TAXI family TRAP transporter solute-binding subunit [Pusillimonas sp. ANT_WB101]KAA0910512.1 TAXI family TRAP transporter solute-binding subunit [Pusillimonas sp. ANT_WB101]
MKRTHSAWRRALLVAAATTTCLSLLPLAANAQNKKLLIGTTSSSSSHYGYFVAVSQVINKQIKGVDTSVTETGATMDNLRRMDRNQVDFALVTTNVIHHANAGTGDFAGKPNNSRLMWIYTIAPQNAIVRKDANIANLEALNGKKLNTGLKGSATEKTTDAVFAALNIKPDVVRGSTGEIVDAVKDNRAIGYVKSGAGMKLDASSREIATFTPIQILGLNDTQRDKIKEAMPELSMVDVPVDSSVGTAAYTTWGFGVGAAASTQLDEETAYQIVKAVCEDKTAQAAAFADVAGVDIAEMTLKYAASPLHPGAIRYFKERGLDIPDRLIAH